VVLKKDIGRKIVIIKKILESENLPYSYLIIFIN
tara:strand:+ start:27 stop:128 length:102 start_codon:yes stop_codon:yes gene_type:complete